MNISVILIEMAVMLIGFGILVFGMLLISPLTFISDYPTEIQAAYYRSQRKEAAKEKLTKLMILKKRIAVLVFLFVFAWDTFFLDWVLFANIKRVRLPGTEHMETEYHQKWFHVKVCFCCFLGTGTDKKNLAGLRSYSDNVQQAVRAHKDFGKTVPKEKSIISILLGNLMLFTVIFSVLGLALKNSLGLNDFGATFLYFLVLGEGLGLFAHALGGKSRKPFDI